MDIIVQVKSHQFDFGIGVSIKVGEPYKKTFAPIDWCEDESSAALFKGVAKESVAAKIVIKFREDTAKMLAENIANQLVTEMKKNDTVMGYPIQR